MVSDEALTQIIFRTRAVLGPYAERLASPRHGARRGPAAGCASTARARGGGRGDAAAGGRVGGVRIRVRTPEPGRRPRAARRHDRGSECQPGHCRDNGESGGAAARAHHGGCDRAATTTLRYRAGRRPRRPRRLTENAPRHLAGAGAATGLVAALLWHRAGTPVDGPIDEGYGLEAGDASHPRTVALLREAFRQDAAGERARALLEAVHDSDVTTPIPALFLGLWSIGSGDLVRADTWLAQARLRIATLPNPNIVALLHYIEAERESDPRAVVRHAGAVLDQRPHAWQMRTARAHLLLTRDMDAAALDELQQIEVPAFTHRKLAMAGADRASLGDVAGAQDVLDRAQDSLDVPEREFLRGRIAWSRGDLPAAQAAFEAAIEAGRRRARFALLQRATLYVGLLQMLQGRSEAAIAAFEQAHASALQSNAVFDQFDIGLLLAELRAELGDTVRAREHLSAVLELARRTPDAQSVRISRCVPGPPRAGSAAGRSRRTRR